jgi:hypothetical protein
MTRTNGSLCILKNHSQNNYKLAALTLPNHFEYATKHGYDIQIMVEPWETAKWGLIPTTLEILKRYTRIFCVGSDVVFTNMEIPLSKFFDDDYGAIVSLENIGGSPINNDTIIINNNAKGIWYLKYLMGMGESFKGAGLHQGLTVDLMRAVKDIVTAKRIQSCYYSKSKYKWEYGDFCLHFLTGDNLDKYNRIEKFLKDGTIVWNNNSV